MMKKKNESCFIIFNDKNNEEFKLIEDRLTKLIDKAQYSLENPDDSD